MILSGSDAEQLACEYLQQQTLHLVTKNYHSRRGEIDLIMQEQQILVFVEVRYRKSSRFGSALESVNRQKQQKIIATASHYLMQNNEHYSAYRFDVVAISPDDNNKPVITWLKDAFQLD